SIERIPANTSLHHLFIRVSLVLQSAQPLGLEGSALCEPSDRPGSSEGRETQRGTSMCSRCQQPDDRRHLHKIQGRDVLGSSVVVQQRKEELKRTLDLESTSVILISDDFKGSDAKEFPKHSPQGEGNGTRYPPSKPFLAVRPVSGSVRPAARDCTCVGHPALEGGTKVSLLFDYCYKLIITLGTCKQAPHQLVTVSLLSKTINGFMLEHNDASCFASDQALTYSVAQATTRRECLNFNATLQPWKGRPLMRLLMALQHSSFHSILVLGYTVTPHQGWPSTHRTLNPCGVKGRGCRASKPRQDHEIYILFLYFQKMPQDQLCSKSSGADSSPHWVALNNQAWSERRLRVPLPVLPKPTRRCRRSCPPPGTILNHSWMFSISLAFTAGKRSAACSWRNWIAGWREQLRQDKALPQQQSAFCSRPSELVCSVCQTDFTPFCVQVQSSLSWWVKSKHEQERTDGEVQENDTSVSINRNCMLRDVKRKDDKALNRKDRLFRVSMYQYVSFHEKAGPRLWQSCCWHPRWVLGPRK
ncbi:hypothetical protein DV515_00000153, partial [Chloebia gouldiae]